MYFIFAFAILFVQKKITMKSDIVQYIEQEILPQYENFDMAHRGGHVRAVIQRALELVPYYPVDENMVYVAAAYHDLGLAYGRELHHLYSGRRLRQDQCLAQWFSPEQIEVMAQAAEDHRASAQAEPRSIYGKIVAEADRLIDADTVIRRTLQYGLDHFPQNTEDGHCERALQHLREKYGRGGYLKVFLPESPNAAALENLQALIADEAKIRPLLHEIFRSLTQN